MFEDHLTFEDLDISDWPNLILLATPIIFMLVLLEWVISVYQNKDTYNGKDFLAALTIGLVSAAISTAIKVFMFGIILFFWNMVPWKIPPTWWSFVLCFFAIDLARYWAHRVSHENRFWWATHVTHHNSLKFNFSVSFRTSWTQPIKFVFFLPVLLMGFHPFVYFICHQLAILYQFWIHTELIKKLPAPIEYIFVTPSHHRVHHGSDEHYLDKNYGSTFIIWDRIFGTFMAEGERPTYGITKNVTTYNPIHLVFHEFVDIYKDLLKAENFREAWQILFGKPGEEVINKRELKRLEVLKEGDKAVPPKNLQPYPILKDNEKSLGQDKSNYS